MAEKPPAKVVPGVNPKAVHIGGESILDRILPHMKKILITIAVITVILTVIFTRKWWIERGQSHDTLKLVAVMQAFDKPIRAKTEPANDTSYADTTERATKSLEAMNAEGAEPNPLYKAGLLMDAGKLDEAIAAYKEASAEPDLDGALAREGLGLALEQKALAEKDQSQHQKLLEDALAAFKSEQPTEGGPRYAYALYHQGRILGELQRNADAKAAFEKAKEAAKTEAEPELRPGQPGYGSPGLADLVDNWLTKLGAS